MKFSLGWLLAVISLTLVFSPAALAGVLWDESVQGDLSDHFASPTELGTLSQ